jgi:hypothetical protein
VPAVRQNRSHAITVGPVLCSYATVNTRPPACKL